MSDAMEKLRRVLDQAVSSVTTSARGLQVSEASRGQFSKASLGPPIPPS